MNYINRLQAEASEHIEHRHKAKCEINDIIKYLSSDKFSCGSELDGYVNIRDILPRLYALRLNLEV